MQYENWPLAVKQDLLDRARQRISDANQYIAEVLQTLTPEERAVYFLARLSERFKRPTRAGGIGVTLTPEEREIRINDLLAQVRAALEVMQEVPDGRLAKTLALLQARELVSPEWSADNFWMKFDGTLKRQT